MKLLVGIVIGYFICVIGIDSLAKTFRLYALITEHTINDVWMKDLNKPSDNTPIRIPPEATPDWMKNLQKVENDKTI